MEFEAVDEPWMNEVEEPEYSKGYDFPIASDEKLGKHNIHVARTTEEYLVDSDTHHEDEKQADLAGGDSSSMISFDSCSPSKVTSAVSSDPWDQECEEDEETLLAAMEDYENSDPIVPQESDHDDLSNSEEDSHVERFESIKTLRSMADDQGKDVFDPTITGEA